MKKSIALLLAAVMCLSLVACGGDTGAANNKAQSVTDADLVGEWYDVKSADRLVLNSDGSLDYYKNNGISQPGHWKLSDGVVDANNVYIDSDLTVVSEKGALSLQNEESTFMQWSGLPKDKLSVGKSGQKENIKITLNDIVFTDELPAYILDSIKGRTDIETFYLNDGMTYAKVSVDIANMSKMEINAPGSSPLMFDVIIDYNDGFRYAVHDNQKSYFVTDTEFVIIDGISSKIGSDIQIQPLMEKSFDIYIPCPELIANDDSAPLTVGIISRYDTEIYYCEYSIK